MLAGPHIIRTNAVVLRSLDYGETSRIATLYTEERGRISVMAKGARASKSRFGSTLDPLSYIQAIVYFKPSRELQSLTDAGHVQAFPRIRESLSRIEIGLMALELTNALMHQDEPNPQIFELLVAVLSELDRPEARIENLGNFFKLRLASLMGYAPGFDKEQVESLGEGGGSLDLESGSIFPREESAPGAATASRSALRAFSITARASMSKVLCMALRPEVARELNELVTSYMRYQYGDSYPGRTAGVFARMSAR